MSIAPSSSSFTQVTHRSPVQQAATGVQVPPTSLQEAKRPSDEFQKSDVLRFTNGSELEHPSDLVVNALHETNAVKALQIIDDYPEMDWNEAGEFRALPLRVAAGQGQLEVVNKLLALGANPNQGENCPDDPNDGETPLLSAVTRNREPDVAETQNWELVITRLLEANADPNQINNDTEGVSPFHVAVKKGDLKLVNTLLAAGANLHKPTIEGQTPIELAEEWGHTELAAHLRTLESPARRQSTPPTSTFEKFKQAISKLFS